MPQPRKPSKVLEMTGAFEKHPDRARVRANEPIPAGKLGNSPRHLPENAKKVWRELAQIIPDGVAGSCDRLAFEMIAVLMGRFRDSSIKGFELGVLNSLLSRFGLTPADRSRVQAAPAGTQRDEWSEFERE